VGNKETARGARRNQITLVEGCVVGQFDQTARPLAKLDGSAFFGWALGCCTPLAHLTFLQWDDTRRLVVPGESDRTNDLVATFRDENTKRQVWLIAEIETEPEPGILYRMGQYELLLAKEVNPSCDPDGSAVGSVVLNLSGTQKTPRLEWAWDGYGTRIAPFLVNAASLDAVAHLEKIERGELGLTILPLLALMTGGGTPEFIERWKRTVERETDESIRRMFRDAVQVLAELTPWQVNWFQGTRDWMMRESQLINSWIREGEDLGQLKRSRYVLLILVRRLEDPIPDTIRLAVEGTTDLNKLDEWFKAALDAKTIADLRKQMQLEP
jgi:hypothetical protein